MTDTASAQTVDSRLVGEVQTLRSEVTLLRDDVALMRSELGALVGTGHVEVDARETVRRLWAEGLASGIAGDVDEVVDDILSTIPDPSPKT